MTTLTEQLRALGANATPAPWHVDDGYEVRAGKALVCNNTRFEAETEFIVAVRNLWEQILAVIEAAVDLDDLLPSVRAFIEDEDLHEHATRVHSALEALERAAKQA